MGKVFASITIIKLFHGAGSYQTEYTQGRDSEWMSGFIHGWRFVCYWRGHLHPSFMKPISYRSEVLFGPHDYCAIPYSAWDMSVYIVSYHLLHDVCT